MANKDEDIPYFIRIRGCNNCKAHHRYITNTGTYNELGHLIRAKCVHMGCVQHGYSVEEPFFEPSVYVRMATHLNSEEVLNEAKKIIFKFHDYYDSEANLLPWVVEAISKERVKNILTRNSLLRFYAGERRRLK